MYKQVLQKKVKKIGIGFNIIAALVLLLIGTNSVLVSYIKYGNEAIKQLNDIISVATRLENDKIKIEQVINSFQEIIGGYGVKFYGIVSLYRTYDEISRTIKGFSLDFVPAKSENYIIKLPITLKGKIKNKELILAMTEYLQTHNYPFVTISSIMLKMGEKDLDIVMSGEIISYDLKSIL